MIIVEVWFLFKNIVKGMNKRETEEKLYEKFLDKY